MKMPDNRFAPNGPSQNVKYVCDSCGKPRTVKLSKTTVPVGAYMVRQHRRRKGRLDDTPPLPARGARRSKWNHKRWAADWRCRDCLSRIYDVIEILRAHKKALLPRPLPGATGEQDDSSSVDTDDAAETDDGNEDHCDEAAEEGDEDSMVMDAPPVAASREQQLETWIRQYRRDDGHTDDPSALLALSQLLEDTGGLYHDLENTEKVLGTSLQHVLGAAWDSSRSDPAGHRGSQQRPAHAGKGDDEQPRGDPAASQLDQAQEGR